MSACTKIQCCEVVRHEVFALKASYNQEANGLECTKVQLRIRQSWIELQSILIEKNTS